MPRSALQTIQSRALRVRWRPASKKGVILAKVENECTASRSELPLIFLHKHSALAVAVEEEIHLDADGQRDGQHACKGHAPARTELVAVAAGAN